MLLDLMLPKINGFAVCELIRKESQVPIIMLTARDDDESQMKGFDVLADDYITKPFTMPLVMRRIEAVLRRTEHGNQAENTVIHYKDISLDADSFTVLVSGESVSLTTREFEILKLFLENQGRVFTRDNLLNMIWGYDYFGDAKIVNTHIKNIRRKLGVDYIETIRGMGYKIEKRISQSIQAKTFISMMILLIGCCIIIYSMVMIFLPKNYQTELEHQVTADFYGMVEMLERNGWEESSDSLLEFSMKNNATVKINDESNNNVFSVNFANMEDDEIAFSSSPSMSCSATFVQDGQTYQLSAIVSLVAVSQSYDILIKLLPFIAAMILLISVIGAFICSRYFSKPLVDICSVAKRMTKLDMTWKCDVKRQDEIGVLAASLNEMAGQLSAALDSLKTANEQLQQDIEKEREQEKQRIDFLPLSPTNSRPLSQSLRANWKG